MRVVRVTSAGRAVDATAHGTSANAPSIFLGEATRQTPHPQSDDLTVTEVYFKTGARTRLHTHTTDQVLIFTEGEGCVGTRTERHDVVPGDVAFIPAGEQHWHGAREGRDTTHWSITGRSQTTIID